MKKFAVCSILLLMSMPLFALGTGISIGVTGGVEMMMDGGDSQNWPAIGATLNFSLPGIPVGIRGGAEYAWKSYPGDITASDILIFLGGQYNISIPMAPVSFYIGAGGELSMANSGEVGAETANDFGVMGLAGVNFSTGMTSIFVESGLGFIFSDPSGKHVPIRGGIKLNL
jgi:hypothetical protein